MPSDPVRIIGHEPEGRQADVNAVYALLVDVVTAALNVVVTNVPLPVVEQTNPLPVAEQTNPLPVAEQTNPLPVENITGGAAVGVANPLAIENITGGAVVGAANPLAIENILGGAVIAPANPVPVAEQTNPLPVAEANPITNVALDAGEAHIGEVGGNTVVVSVTPTITAGLYAANDVVGGIQTLTGAARLSGKEVFLESIVVTDLAAQDVNLVFYFFNANPATGTYTDNAELDIDDADMALCIGSWEVQASDYLDAKDNSVATVTLIGLPLTPVGSANLYVVVKTTGTPTYAETNGLTFRYGLSRN